MVVVRIKIACGKNAWKRAQCVLSTQWALDPYSKLHGKPEGISHSACLTPASPQCLHLSHGGAIPPVLLAKVLGVICDSSFSLTPKTRGSFSDIYPEPDCHYHVQATTVSCQITEISYLVSLFLSWNPTVGSHCGSKMMLWKCKSARWWWPPPTTRLLPRIARCRAPVPTSWMRNAQGAVKSLLSLAVLGAGRSSGLSAQRRRNKASRGCLFRMKQH